MPNPPPARGANAAPVVEEEQSPFRKAFGVIQQFLLIWLAMQFVTRFFAPKSDTTPPPSPATTDIAGTAGIPPATTVEVTQAYPAWPLGIPVAMHVYLSTSPTGDVFSRKWTSGYRQDQDADLPHFAWKNITYGNYDEERVAEYDVNIPVSVQHNGTLWADIFLTRDGTSPDPSDASFNPRNVHHIRKLLTHYLPKSKVQKEKNLLGSNEPQEFIEEPEPEGDIITSHWHRNLTIALVSDATVIPPKQIPIAMAPYIHLLPDRDQTGTKGFYQPIVFPNDFWHLRSQYIEINTTTPTLPLQITFQPMSYMKFQIFSTMTYSFQEASKQQGVSMGQFDEIKRMLVETNPYFLALTGIVSLLHVLFEFLAFSSDVSHWRHKQELVGVSVRIVTNVVVQIIVLLYLIDNNEETSWMILMGSGTGVLIEAWKITKAVDISFGASPPGSIIPYSIIIKDKHVLSEDEKKTQEYDKLAFRYVSWAAIPCLAAYTVYSLLYLTHKGWYSFIISTLTSFVYMFGFAQLVPQLIINYKLKSVAHMPMKAMIYKTLSTVVDDLFAFCIKMPILHRLACFRDDVVFLVFLYQRWIYRVDPKRVNEYGQVMGSDADAVAEKKDKGSAKETKKNK
ncbi:cleft lip and palate associated transmembrane protein [Abortiporus biennis]|nr:cleft lip and palate associated transmembrane protein [Abortiporus biennis]